MRLSLCESANKDPVLRLLCDLFPLEKFKFHCNVWYYSRMSGIIDRNFASNHVQKIFELQYLMSIKDLKINLIVWDNWSISLTKSIIPTWHSLWWPHTGKINCTWSRQILHGFILTAIALWAFVALKTTGLWNLVGDLSGTWRMKSLLNRKTLPKVRRKSKLQKLKHH